MSFENRSEYSAVNFSLLNEKLGNASTVDAYYSNWMGKYAKVFRGCKARTVIDWDVRTSKSLKEVFTASAFFLEAKACRKINAWSSFYYLSYYSLFHALLANVYLLPEESMDSLSDINHSKLINVFNSVCVNTSPKIIGQDVKNSLKY